MKGDLKVRFVSRIHAHSLYVQHTNRSGRMKMGVHPTFSLQLTMSESAWLKHTNHNGGSFLFCAFASRPSINPCSAFTAAPAGCSWGQLVSPPPKNDQQACMQKDPSWANKVLQDTYQQCLLGLLTRVPSKACEGPDKKSNQSFETNTLYYIWNKFASDLAGHPRNIFCWRGVGFGWGREGGAG